MDKLISDLLQQIASNSAVQVIAITAIGKLMQAGAAWLEQNKAPDDRGKVVLGLIVTLLSLVGSFLQQYQAGTLNAFDPKPWTDFFLLITSTASMLWVTDKAEEKAKAFMAKRNGGE